MEALQEALQQGPSCKLTPKEILELVRKCSNEELEALGLSPASGPPAPSLPTNYRLLPPSERLKAIQEFISTFKYNHTPNNFVTVAKHITFAQLVSAAQNIVQTSLPIRCLEGVFLGLHLTAGWDTVDRYPVGFKTSVEGHVYRHIVLVVHHKPSNLFGALGLSRRKELMDKELSYSSMGSILLDYKEAYEKWGHKVLKIRVGLPAPSDPAANTPICWRYCNLNVGKMEWSQAAHIFNQFTAQSHSLGAQWLDNAVKKKPEEYAGPGLGAGSTPAQAQAPTPTPPSGPSLSPRRRQRFLETAGLGGVTVAAPWADGYASSSDDATED